MASIILSADRLLTEDEMAFFDYMAARGEATNELPYTLGLASGITKPFYLATQGLGTLSTTMVLTGDFNSDGVFDAADYIVWQDNLGLSASALNGNGSGAATVVQADYLLWKTNFEALATASEGATAVPEPATLLLALLALAAVPHRVRHR